MCNQDLKKNVLNFYNMYIFKYIHRKFYINPTNILEITHIFVNMFRVVLDLTRVMVLCQQSRVEINYFFKHEYQPLPQNVTEAVIPTYIDLGHKKVLKRCWFFHTKQRKLQSTDMENCGYYNKHCCRHIL